MGFHSLDDERVAALSRGYMAHAGRFEVDEARAVATHHFELCLDPALIGTLQERHVKFIENGRLELSVAAGTSALDASSLLWQRD